MVITPLKFQAKVLMMDSSPIGQKIAYKDVEANCDISQLLVTVTSYISLANRVNPKAHAPKVTLSTDQILSGRAHQKVSLKMFTQYARFI